MPESSQPSPPSREPAASSGNGSQRLVRMIPWLLFIAGGITSIFFLLLYVGLRDQQRSVEAERTTAKQNAASMEARLHAAIADRERAEARSVEMVWLADLALLRDLRDEVDELFPLHPDLLPRLEEWGRRAKSLSGNQEVHRRTLAQLEKYAEEGAHPASARERDQIRQSFEALVAGVPQLLDAKKGRLAVVEKRIRMIHERRRISLEDNAARWAEVIDAVSDRERSPQYDGLSLTPQYGLVPLGADPQSKNQEFAHVGSGNLAVRGADGSLEIGPRTGIVFVLTPIGHLVLPNFPNGLWGIQIGRVTEDGVEVSQVTYGSTSHKMGLLAGDELVEFEEISGGERSTTGKLRLKIVRNGETVTLEGPATVDPTDLLVGKPIRFVDVPSFFIAKTELTRGQWSRLRGRPAPLASDASLPVTGVLGTRFVEALRRESLLPPTVDQWHFAAGGATFTKYWTGDTEATLVGAENVPAPPDPAREPGAEGAVAPVATLKANPFGLYDVLGNVREWCRIGEDGSLTLRGGSWETPLPLESRRTSNAEASSGIRPALEIP